MANNYLQFSFIVGDEKHPIAKEHVEAFMQRMGRSPQCWDCGKIEWIINEDGETPDAPDCHACQEYPDSEGPGFSAQIDREEYGSIWINSGEDSGDISAAADAVEWLIKRSGSDEIVLATYACTCSKLRVDEFSGGSVVISREGQQWFNSSDAERYIKELEMRRREKAEEAAGHVEEEAGEGECNVTVYEQFCDEEADSLPGMAQTRLLKRLMHEGLLVDLAEDYVLPKPEEESNG